MSAHAPTEGAHIVVKFADRIDLPYDDKATDHIAALDPVAWGSLSAAFPNLTFRRMFTSVPAARIRELVGTARQRDSRYAPPNFLTYFVVDLEPSTDVDALIEALRSYLPAGTRVYFDPPGEDPGTPGGGVLPYNQGYLHAAPEGIDAEFAWTFAGGDGSGQHFVDMEKGWTLDHEALAPHNAQKISGDVQDGARPHGTAVLGEVCALDNDKGVVGIAGKLAKVSVASHYNSNRPDAMMAAIAALPYGGTLLLEAQLSLVSTGNPALELMPIEVQQADYDVICLATAIGIAVIEAGGNRGANLDAVTDDLGHFVLDRTHGDYRESGAVMVGAATSTDRARIVKSNYGNRIDCYAWGECVATTDTTTTAPFATDKYRRDFEGTSSASAIVAGASLCIQGIASQSLGFPLSAFQMRDVLRNPTTGTPSKDPASDRIGVMPDLKRIITGIGVAADLYLRDFVGDDGSPHMGPISTSPDIILRSAATPNPQAAFGQGSGTENSDSLGQAAVAGQDNYLYVRARNRGAKAAANASVDVYWAPVSTLPTPDSWTLVGSASLAAVQGADVLTVFGPIVWRAAEIPAAGHYCFVGIAGSADDPAPSIPAKLKWDEFRRLIRDNNNVTWRNFNVVDIQPSQSSQPADFVVLDLIVPGAPDQDRRMDLEVFARLPLESIVLLEMPAAMYRNLSYRWPARAWSEEGDMVVVAANPHGSFALESIHLPRQARFALRLLVQVPEHARGNPYEVYVRQIDEGLEVGRVTWRLTPRTAPTGLTTAANQEGRTAMNLIKNVSKDLEAAGFQPDQISRVARAISENFPPRTYLIAVWFLGSITAALAVGALYLSANGKAEEALWVALGAGIGALAGIFAAKE